MPLTIRRLYRNRSVFDAVTAPWRLALCAAIAVTVPGVAVAQDVPIPRISPLKLQAEAPAIAPEDETLDTDLIPPSTADGTPIDLALPASPLDQPLSLAPVAPGAEDSVGLGFPDPNAGPIDLSGGTQPNSIGQIPADPATLGTLTIEARMTADSQPLQSGVVWRVFSTDPMPDGKLRLVGEAAGGTVTLKLRPETYLVHAAYGDAGYSKQVVVSARTSADSIVLDAGGMRLSALVGNDRTLPAQDIKFDIYAADETGPAERLLLVKDAPPAKVISLNAGIYHVVCKYGNANAIVRADIRVEPGKLTEAAVYQNAARLTMKLVEERGGEALANTQWQVIDAEGQSLLESVGAFPTVILAEGEYKAIARNGDQVYEHAFTVEPGVDRDVEVLLAAN